MCPWGKCPGGKRPGGMCPWGNCLGVHIQGGGVCPVTVLHNTGWGSAGCRTALRICAGTVVCPNITSLYIAYRQGREMCTQIELDVEYYNLVYISTLVYKYPWAMPGKTIHPCHPRLSPSKWVII